MDNKQTVRVWYTNINGCITKSYNNPITNKIIQEKIPFNHPSNFTKWIDDYFKNKLK
jgi:hypothetical protein